MASPKNKEKQLETILDFLKKEGINVKEGASSSKDPYYFKSYQTEKTLDELVVR